ncbi:MAG: hypothetical protein AAGE94_17080, partial [Acidobacteriota bacterium]
MRSEPRPIHRRLSAISFVLVLLTGCAGTPPVPDEPPDARRLVDDYLTAYLDMFPSRATGAGSYDHDEQFEDFSSARLEDWLILNRRTLEQLDGIG